MARRGNSVAQALQAFGATYGMTRGIMRDRAIADVMDAKPEEINSDFSTVEDTSTPATRQAILGSFEGEPVPDAAPAQGLAMQVPTTRYDFMGEQQATPFDADQIRGLRNDKLADIEAKWGDPRQALKMQATNESLGETRRARKAAEAKQNNLAELDTLVRGIFDDLNTGNLDSYMKFMGGLTGKNMPGWMSFDRTDGSLGLMTQDGDGAVGFQKINPYQALSYAVQAAHASDTGRIQDGLASLFDSLGKEEDRQLKNANVRSQMQRREDQTALGLAGLQDSSARGWFNARSQDQRRSVQNARDSRAAAPQDFMRMGEGDLRKANARLDARLKDFDKANEGDLGTPEVLAARDRIVADERERMVTEDTLRTAVPAVRSAIQDGGAVEDVVSDLMELTGGDEELVQMVLATAGVELPRAEAPSPAPAPRARPAPARGKGLSLGEARARGQEVLNSGRRYEPPRKALPFRAKEGWWDEEEIRRKYRLR